MKRVLFVITSLDTGGAEMMLYKLLSRLHQNDIKAAVVCLRKPGLISNQIDSLGVQVFHLGINSFRCYPRLLKKMVKIFREFRPEVIQGWMYHGNFLAWFMQKIFFPKAKLIWSIRQSLSSLKSEKYNTHIIIRFCAWLSKSVDSIVYNSEKSLSDHENIGYSSNKSKLIDNGFDTQIFCPNDEMRSMVRRELEIPLGSKLIGLINRYHAVKGHDVFFQAAIRLCTEREDIYFLLAGRGIDEFNHKLASWYAHPVLKNKIRLLGERKDVNKLTAALDIASSTSLWGEGFPNVVGEAMSCGIPIVGSDVGDTRRVIGDIGIIVPPNDSVALAKAWANVLNRSAEDLHKLKVASRQRVISLFSLDTIAQKYSLLYNRA